MTAIRSQLFSRGLRAACLAAALAGAAVVRTAPATYQVLDNFTTAVPGLPEGGQISSEPDFKTRHVGLASAKVAYHMDAKAGMAVVNLPELTWKFSGPGALKVWVKGGGAAGGPVNELEVVVRHAAITVQANGQRTVDKLQDIVLPRVKLDAGDWKEVSFDVGQIPAGDTAWLQVLRVFPPAAAATAPATGPAAATKPSLDGTFWLDDLRFYGTGNQPSAAFAADLIGPTARNFTTDIAASLDVRSFSDKPAKVRARLTVNDRNDNLVADRDFPIELAPGEAKELKLAAEPENLESFLPPFKVALDVISTDLTEANGRTERTLVMSNSLMLFDNFADVRARWFTAGYGPTEVRAAPVTWIYWTHGEMQRCTALPQTTTAISRVAVDPAAAATQPAPNPSAPLGQFAMQMSYKAGEGVVYSSRDRYLPGNANRMGVWVKGDGSGSTLTALILDYTDGGDFWYGGWKRIISGELPLCVLNFTDWRYVEVVLPGNGVGKNTPRGSTDDVDFPLELTAFRVAGEKPDTAGTVQIGSVYVYTQQPAAGALSVHMGYDDPYMAYSPEKSATVTVQNGWRVGTRKIRSTWTLTDRTDATVASGNVDFDLAAGQQNTFKLKFADQAAEIAKRLGPFRLQVTASDVRDVSVTASRQMILARPESVVHLADFETNRGYLGVKGNGITTPPPPGEPAAKTSTDQAHSGKRSLAITWDKEKLKQTFVSVDPPVPGVPTEISLWVFGDGGNEIFYPLIGDKRGVSKGTPNGGWDFLLPESEQGPLQNVVRVDWKGWRELKFRLPAIPPSWQQDLPIMPFVLDYPIGIHLAVLADGATAPGGTVYVDDITLQTHLLPEQRVQMALNRAGESSVQSPADRVQVTLTNYDAQAPRTVKVSGGIYDWRNANVAAIDQSVTLPAGQSLPVDVAAKLPVGSYVIRLTARDDKTTLAAVDEDLLVADLAPTLGKDWPASLHDAWKLRAPIRDRYTFIDEDWDWVEHFPGSTQLDSIRLRCGEVTTNGADPYLLLGYAAFWSSGVGLEQVKAGALMRRQRDIGHAVDIFLIPERIDDWSQYTQNVMRGVGKEIGGFVVWNNPEADNSLGVPPERFAKLLETADQWRRLYCPKTPMLIGGMARQSAIPYLTELAKFHGLEHITGVNVRLDVGRLSPEDAEVAAYVRELQKALDSQGEKNKTIELTDLDWAAEKDPQGLNGFGQAAYLIRAALVLGQIGIQPALSIRNEDDVRLGLGLTYKDTLSIPPMTEKLTTFQLRPGWWGLARTHQWLEQLEPAVAVETADVVPDRTRCLLYKRKADGKPVAVIWRNDDAGFVSFGQTGMAAESAEDMFGTPVPAADGWYAVGKLPTVFVLTATAEPGAQALTRLRVRDTAEPAWAQRTLAAFTPATGQRNAYTPVGGEAATLTGRGLSGENETRNGLKFAKGGSEKFSVDVPVGSDLILRKQYFLDETGQAGEVFVNGQSAGKWNLLRTDAQLSGGLRDAVFFVPKALLAGKPKADIELRYATAGNTTAWTALEYRGGDFPLSALGPVHADQNAGHLRLARNTIGETLKVGTTPFANGLGTFARSLVEYPLNGQFARFTAKVGVDAATEGRGSVTFEVYADGKKVFSTPVMTGLDQPRSIDLDVKNVDRLRLVVTDGGDGNKFDAADWCEPTLSR